MSAIYSWVGNIVFYLIFITVVTSLLPGKKYERYLKLFAGMVLILLVLKPLTGSLNLEDKIAYYFESITFRNESGDLEKEIMGMEKQRLSQMITQYEEAVAMDVEAMAQDMEFHPRHTKVTIENNPDSQQFGTVTHIEMTVSRAAEDAEKEADSDVSRTNDNDVEQSDQIQPIQEIAPVEPVEIGEEEAEAAVVPDEGLNRLRRKVEEYYGLKTADVEIRLVERER